MSASFLTTRWSDDVIRRAVRAWIAGYGIPQDSFAISIGMKPRTFARRLAGSGPQQAFSGGEIARMSAYMSEVCGDKVSIEDLYAGRISVWGQLDGPASPESPLPSVRRVLRSLPGGGAHIQTSRPQFALVGAST